MCIPAKKRYDRTPYQQEDDSVGSHIVFGLVQRQELIALYCVDKRVDLDKSSCEPIVDQASAMLSTMYL